MIEEITSGLFRIKITLPRNPLKATNSYLIKAGERSLVIDTGMNCNESMEAMEYGLKTLNVAPNNTDYFITHLHYDHVGLLERLDVDSSTVYFGRKEAELANYLRPNREKHWESYRVYYSANGFPESELDKVKASLPVFKGGFKKKINSTFLNDGDFIRIGDFHFKCVETPGHTPAHMCLYEANKKILVSGDHILFGITPNIASRPEVQDSLNLYFGSLKKLDTLEVALTLPGHGDPGKDLRNRTSELLKHHKERLLEVLMALRNGAKTAFQTAPHLTWNINHNSWETFPAVQKWFATGETLAHLNYLVRLGKIAKQPAGNLIYYSLSGTKPAYDENLDTYI